MEKKQAKRDGADLVPNSGRGSSKGDARLPEFLLDYKFNAKSFHLNVDNWDKHRRDSWKEDNREPLIKVCFADGTNLVIIDEYIFNEMYYQWTVDYE